MADDGTAEAKRLIAERRYAEAIVVCRRLLLLGPDRSEVRLLLGEALLAEERWDEVRVEMLALIRRSPTVAAAHRLLGEAFLRDGQSDKAKDPLARAVELAPNDAVAKELLEEAQTEPFKDAHTIERWFGDEEGRTVESALPDFTEEDTPVPARAAPSAEAPPRPAPVVLDEPSIQIDPSLAAELARLEGASPADITQPMPPSSAQAAGLRSLLATAKPATAKPTTTKPTPRSAKPTLIGGPSPVAPKGGAVPRAASADETHVARPGATPRPGPAPVAAVAAALRSRSGEPPTMELPLGALADEESDEDELTGRLPALGTAALPPSPHAPSGARGGAAPSPSAPPPPRASSSAFPPAGRAPAPSGLPRPSPALPPGGLAPAAPLAAPPPASAPIAGASAGSFPPPSAAPLPASAPIAGAGAFPAPAAFSGPPPAAPGHGDRPRLGSGPTTGVEPPTKQKIRLPGAALVRALGLGEHRRRTAVIAAGLAVALGLVGALGWLAFGGDGGRAVAVLTASTDGRPASYEAALALAPPDAGGELAALRARLCASASLELGIDRLAEAETLLAGLDAETAASAEARLAGALVAIGRGQAERALTLLSSLTATDVTLVETFRARALALAALGRHAEALDAARQAATLVPEAPRHAALLASTALAAGDAAMGLRALGDATRATTLRLARAEIDVADGGDASTAAADVEAVLSAADVTGPERARASLVRARLRAAAGDAAGALSDLAAAETLAPSWDEPSRLAIAELFLSANEASRARAALALLPATSSAPARRAELLVRAALALGDLATAETAVVGAGTGPRIDMLRATIAEARGRAMDARALYASAAADPTLLVAARTAEGAILLGAGSAAEARTALASALAADPEDGSAVLPSVCAALLTGDRTAAERAARAAQALHPERAEIAAASGIVALASGRAAEAVPLLRTATAALPTDGELRLDLATAEWRSAALAEAAATLEAALASAPPSPRALSLAIDVAIDRGRFDEAQATIERLAGAGAPASTITERRASLAAARGLGRAALRELEAAADRSRDVRLLVAVARLQIQAEADRDARRTLARVRRADRDDPHVALLGAILDTHGGNLGRASSGVDAAERTGEAQGATSALRALVRAVRGRLRFEASDLTEARRLGEEAVALDPLCAEAHHLLADVAIVGGGDPVPSLRSAAAGTYPMPEVVGRLAIRLRTGDEACAFARQYAERAPRGYDAADVGRVLDRCD